MDATPRITTDAEIAKMGPNQRERAFYEEMLAQARRYGVTFQAQVQQSRFQRDTGNGVVSGVEVTGAIVIQEIEGWQPAPAPAPAPTEHIAEE